MFKWALLGGILLAGFAPAGAQPVLPAVAAKVAKGGVVLSWTCQYGNVASITVGRSVDSTGVFPVIGTLGKVKKGPMTFSDNSPIPGRSFYRLQILFASGLKWSSDFVGVSLPAARARVPREVVPELPASTPNVRPIATAGGASVPLAGTQEPLPMPKAPPVSIAPVAAAKAEPTLRINPDSVHQKLPAASPRVSDVHKADSAIRKHAVKFSDTAPDTAGIAYVFIKSAYFSADPVSRNVAIALPPDVKTVHYALRIYDAAGKLVLQVPHLDEVHMVMDRRNFRKKGVYLFVLKKDGAEVERANVKVE